MHKTFHRWWQVVAAWEFVEGGQNNLGGAAVTSSRDSFFYIGQIAILGEIEQIGLKGNGYILFCPLHSTDYY